MSRPARLLLGALSLLSASAFGCDAAPAPPDASRPRDAGGALDGGGGMDAGPPRDAGGGNDLCDALQAFASRCGAAAQPCDAQLVAGCGPLTAALGPAFVASVEACLPTSNPTNCFFDAMMAMGPSAAQTTFRDAYCAGCRSDEPSCATEFFSSGEAARAIVVAVSDATTAQLDERCASGVLCAETFDLCAAETLGLLGVPAATAECFVETLLAPRALPPGCGEALPDAGVDGGAGPSDAGVDGGPAPTDGGTVTPLACTAYEPNEARGAARDLGAIDDRTTFPSGNVSAGLGGGSDQDFYAFYDEDLTGGALYPRVDLVITGSPDLELCAFYACDSGADSTIACRAGTATEVDGLGGCCSLGTTSTESVVLDPDCPGLDDSGTVYVRVYGAGAIPACAPYFLAWGDD